MCGELKQSEKLQHKLGCLSDLYLINAIENNIVPGDFTKRDVCIASEIYDNDPIAIKAKSTKSKSKLRREDGIIDLPKNVIKYMKDITLSVDIMDVNGLLLVIFKSWHIGHYQAVPLQKKDSKHIKDALIDMIR